ncbi:MAG TPA: TMEM175 family protein [Acidimicrobiia bacterium]|nr:TMEM175 family protein [Acidimicrobiia bacterium]
MTKNRLETITDGVLAIVITIIVLELHVPESAGLSGLRESLPLLAAYAFTFVHIGIYWNNHHNLIHSVKQIDGAVLWANLVLLFWLSLFPFVIRWFAEVGFASMPVAAFGAVLWLASMSYFFLVKALIRVNGPDSTVAKAVGRDRKGWLSTLIYTVSVAVAFVSPLVAILLYGVVALMWLVPDRRFGRT